MRWKLGSGMTFMLALATSCAWSQSEPIEQPAQSDKKLVIGTVSGLKRPDGFMVEDLRSDAMKTSTRRQTYKREFNPFRFGPPGPLARYENNIGDAELNVSPVDFIAEQMILRYGGKLGGKRLVLREFSLLIKESIDKPQGVMAIPMDPASVGAAIVTSVLGTALIRGLGSGRSLELVVKIDAELDGIRFQGSDFGSIIVGASDGRPAKIVNQALSAGFYGFEKMESPEKRKIESLPAEQGSLANTSPSQ